MSANELKQVSLTDVCVTPRIEKIIKKLEARHPEVKGLLINSGRLTNIGKVMLETENQRIADREYDTDLQQGGLGVSW